MTTTYIEIPTLTLEMMMGLTEAELKTLLIIVRHTAAMNRESVMLTYAEMSYGMYGDDGRMLIRGNGLCFKSIGRAITSLVDKGYITAERRRGRRTSTNSDITQEGGTHIFCIALSYRMRPLREWTTGPNAKPVPEARYGLKKPMAA